MPCTDSRAMRALLTTNETSLAIRGSLPYQVMLNVDGINIYIMTYVTIDDDQIGLPVFRIDFRFLRSLPVLDQVKRRSFLFASGG